MINKFIAKVLANACRCTSKLDRLWFGCKEENGFRRAVILARSKYLKLISDGVKVIP